MFTEGALIVDLDLLSEDFFVLQQPVVYNSYRLYFKG